jgi:hypothetical protein
MEANESVLPALPNRRAAAALCAAKRTCKLYKGQTGCSCDRGHPCTAVALWGDIAAAVVLGLEREGYLKLE